ncbi:hypothetical protein FHT87_005206 [Rhizobium sp. BK316]|uniref:hypothetical protein n=1 Tax=Rhizobium sp. BK316 TaxID=2587053 RepID=UPI00161F1FEA|nr:hypothetical protein [Rhizobium sp. BK316]MBB3411253.1 hypothetical protein [Rhizobium sp. BK316]
MLNVSAYPFCAARLKFQRCNLSEEGFTKFWAAVNVATDLDDDALTEFGGFNFDDRSDENGERLLSRLELFIRTKVAGKKAKSDIGNMSSAESSVRAFLGANGVKVGKLDGIEDYWRAARILWGDRIDANPKVKDVYTLVFQLNRIPKKQRPKIARGNKSLLPNEWRAAA